MKRLVKPLQFLSLALVVLFWFAVICPALVRGFGTCLSEPIA